MLEQVEQTASIVALHGAANHVPCVQLEHAVHAVPLPVPVENVPASQVRHSPCSGALLYVPVPQATGARDAIGQKVPGGQIEQSKARVKLSALE